MIVSVTITNGMPVWPSDPPLKLTPQKHLARDMSHTIQGTTIEMGSPTEPKSIRPITSYWPD
ncbi:MAG TPA: hypothetical protein VK210_13520 [Terriglobia bacterium]|nr:hypothetical protein [Terriglobia bacterium]